MKIVLISDTHGFCPEVPDGDVLIHAGDFTFTGTRKEIAKAGKWFQSLPHRYKLAVAGNHDWLFETDRDLAQHLLCGTDHRITYLENDWCEIDWVRFYGSPVTPEFNDWAFNVKRGAKIKGYWDNISERTDVLITHGPPKGILDQANTKLNTFQCGCEDLLDAVKRVKPEVHVFGHIHGGYGHYKTSFGTDCYNASLVDEAYKLTNAPWVIEI
jgi:Icc-related predicted phosphoesterase